MRKAMLVIAAAACAGSAYAQQGSKLDAAAAEAIIAGCKANASANGRSHAIAVVDAGGNPVATLRMDHNTAGIMAFAEQKARAAAMWGFGTGAMERSVKDTPGFANAPYVVTVAGGLPIYSGDGKTFLGGAGASGEAPELDSACIEAGLKAAGLRSSPLR